MTRNSNESMSKPAIEVKFTPDETLSIMRYVSVIREAGKVLNEKSTNFMDSFHRIMRLINSKPEAFSEECLTEIEEKAMKAYIHWDFAKGQAIQAAKKKTKAVKTA